MLETERTFVELLEPRHAAALSFYYASNQAHLAPWEPTRAHNYHSASAWRERAMMFQQENQAGSALRVVAFKPGDETIAGVCMFTNISRGPFQACNLGYSIASQFAGQGLMTEIVDAAVRYVFKDLKLHRVMANYMPENEASARVLVKLGFEKEGYAKAYLKIAGEWRDHVLTSKLNPEML